MDIREYLPLIAVAVGVPTAILIARSVRGAPPEKPPKETVRIEVRAFTDSKEIGVPVTWVKPPAGTKPTPTSVTVEKCYGGPGCYVEFAVPTETDDLVLKDIIGAYQTTTADGITHLRTIPSQDRVVKLIYGPKQVLGYWSDGNSYVKVTDAWYHVDLLKSELKEGIEIEYSLPTLKYIAIYDRPLHGGKLPNGEQDPDLVATLAGSGKKRIEWLTRVVPSDIQVLGCPPSSDYPTMSLIKIPKSGVRPA